MTTFYNLAREITTTTGTDSVVLSGAVAGCNTFDDAGVPNAETVHYSIITFDLATHLPVDSECGEGVYTTATKTLTRATVESSTQGGAKITLTGLSHVFITPLASDFIPAAPGGGGVSSAQYSGNVPDVVDVTAGNNATIPFTLENWDDDALGSVAGNTLTFSTAGKYIITASVYWTIIVAGAPTGWMMISMTGLGTQRETRAYAAGATTDMFFFAFTTSVEANDTLQLNADNATNKTIRFWLASLAIVKIGD